MRETHTCPKCQHPEVLYLPTLSDQGEGYPATLHAVVKTYTFRGTYRWGRIEAYICRKCGFTELYTESPDSIPIAEVPGARICKAKPREPYRLSMCQQREPPRGGWMANGATAG